MEQCSPQPAGPALPLGRDRARVQLEESEMIGFGRRGHDGMSGLRNMASRARTGGAAFGGMPQQARAPMAAPPAAPPPMMSPQPAPAPVPTMTAAPQVMPTPAPVQMPMGAPPAVAATMGAPVAAGIPTAGVQAVGNAMAMRRGAGRAGGYK